MVELPLRLVCWRKRMWLLIEGVVFWTHSISQRVGTERVPLPVVFESRLQVVALSLIEMAVPRAIQSQLVHVVDWMRDMTAQKNQVQTTRRDRTEGNCKMQSLSMPRVSALSLD